MTINYARESVIDFTKPFMNLGIGILFKVSFNILFVKFLLRLYLHAISFSSSIYQSTDVYLQCSFPDYILQFIHLLSSL